MREHQLPEPSGSQTGRRRDRYPCGTHSHSRWPRPAAGGCGARCAVTSCCRPPTVSAPTLVSARPGRRPGPAEAGQGCGSRRAYPSGRRCPWQRAGARARAGPSREARCGVVRRTAVPSPNRCAGLPGGIWSCRRISVPANPDLLISLDVGSVERLGSLARLLDTCRQSLVIDHHPSNTRFGQFHLIDATPKPPLSSSPVCWTGWASSSTGHIAENLYAGLATDTGHFRHAEFRCPPACGPTHRRRGAAART